MTSMQTQPEVRPQMGLPALPALVIELRDWLIMLERAVAGHASLNNSLLHMNEQEVKGVRKKGLPILTTKASLDGVNTIDIAFDLKKMPTDHVHYVLLPLISMQAMAMKEAVDEILGRADRLGAEVDKILHAMQEAQQQPQ